MTDDSEDEFRAQLEQAGFRIWIIARRGSGEVLAGETFAAIDTRATNLKGRKRNDKTGKNPREAAG